LFSVVISTKPTSIPNQIEVDISEMEVGESIRVEDLKFPEGVKAAMAAETTVATAVVTRSTLEAMRADEEAEAAEGEDAATPAAGDAGDE
jgi:large subunit ribosomal protein L25